jgi:hypothetical protein
VAAGGGGEGFAAGGEGVTTGGGGGGLAAFAGGGDGATPAGDGEGEDATTLHCGRRGGVGAQHIRRCTEAAQSQAGDALAAQLAALRSNRCCDQAIQPNPSPLTMTLAGQSHALLATLNTRPAGQSFR